MRKTAPFQSVCLAGDLKPTPTLQPHDIFGALYSACRDPPDRERLISLLQADWQETDLAAFACYHYGKAFRDLSERQLRSIITSAFTNDYFVRLFRKERFKHLIAPYARRRT